MTLDWIFFLEAEPNVVPISRISLGLLIGGGIAVGAIAALAGQKFFRTIIRSLGLKSSSRFDHWESKQDSPQISSDSMELTLQASEDTANSEDSFLSDTTKASQSDRQSNESKGKPVNPNAVRNTAKRLGKVAQVAKTALSESSNGNSAKDSKATPSSRSSTTRTESSNGSISRYERAAKKASNPEIASPENPRKMNASKKSSEHGSGLSNGSSLGTSHDTVMSVLQSFVASHRSEVTITASLLIADLVLWILPHPTGYLFIEVPVSLGVAIDISWLGSQLFRDFFDGYLLNAAVREGRKLNSEFLILGKFAANGLIILIAVVAFAQTHQINIFGIVASLGIGGLAVAFAAQKTLEQLLGGIVIYLDRPFIVDDYVGLPDGTFGRVESIGLRSTKVRTSGKGTLMIVPNSVLTQINIENFTGAKKVMSIVYLNLYRLIPEDEKALIRQVILESTSDIFGIDSRSTDVTFRSTPRMGDRTQVQITFFILGSGEVSMDLRRQVLDLANQNVTQQLLDYGLRFDLEEPTIYVDSPITI